MIIVKLTYGLGNNLYQYALGRRLALERQTELQLDFSGESEGRRHYALDYLSNFNMIQTEAPKREIKKLKWLNQFSFLNPRYKN